MELAGLEAWTKPVRIMPVQIKGREKDLSVGTLIYGKTQLARHAEFLTMSTICCTCDGYALYDIVLLKVESGERIEQ